MNEREKFEKWFSENGTPLSAGTGYRLDDVSFRSWQACAEQKDARIAELEADLAAMTQCAKNHDEARTKYQLGNAQCEELAAQNQQMRESLSSACEMIEAEYSDVPPEFTAALALPDKASEILRKRDAQVLRKMRDLFAEQFAGMEYWLDAIDMFNRYIVSLENSHD